MLHNILRDIIILTVNNNVMGIFVDHVLYHINISKWANCSTMMFMTEILISISLCYGKTGDITVK